ncbi:MAG: SH3 domain-containing protein [Bacteroidetes bacterium]|nr:SH3 domain-containing protein [Bacteroidota bacterium]
MSKEKSKGILSSVEFIIILVFFIAFITWMVPKCKGGPDPIPQPLTMADSLAEAQRLLDSIQALEPAATEEQASAKAETPKVETRVVGRLYVTIDGLKVRKEHNLKSDVIVELPLYEEVYFMDEVTDFKEEISLGYEVANEPWVKVRTKKGHEGWVYGAGVNYYKQKRGGVLE